MNFLLDNPIAAMDGTSFLVLFIVLNIVTLATLVIAKSNIDNTDKLPTPAIPPEVDPYEVAYLRGGANELARSVIFSLMQKGLIEVVTWDKTNRIKRVDGQSETRGLPELERIALSWLGTEREAKEVFDKHYGLVNDMGQQISRYQIGLSGRQFLMPDEWKGRAKKYALAASGLIAAVGGYKILAAILVGRFNIIFTVILTLLGVGIAYAIGRMPRMTKLGRQYIDRLQMAFEDLKYRSQAPYIGTNARQPVLAEAGNAGIDPLLLSVGVFGTGILAGTMFANYNDVFARSRQDAASSSSGCGSSCGSSRSSGDAGGGSSCSSGDGGGGSCGGGCGGCS